MTRIVGYQSDVLVIDLVDGSAGLRSTDAGIRDRSPFGAAPMLVIIGEVAQCAARQWLIALAKTRPGERLMTAVACARGKEKKKYFGYRMPDTLGNGRGYYLRFV